MSWDGAVADTSKYILPLAGAGVPGRSAFLFIRDAMVLRMIDQQQLEAALPFIAESGLPLLVHAELAGPIDEAAARLQDA